MQQSTTQHRDGDRRKNRDVKEPTRYLIYERWKTLADMEAHLKSLHITSFEDELKGILTASPERQLLVPVGE